MSDVLRIGARNCPKDREPLLWQTYNGVRLYQDDGKQTFYVCRCSKCGSQYKVRRAWT